MSRRALILLAVTALLACDSPVIPGREAVVDAADCPATAAEVRHRAYDFRPLQRAVVRWPRGARIDVAVYSREDAERTALLEAAFTRAARVWNDAVLYGEYRIVRAGGLGAAEVLIRWAGEPAPVDMDVCPPNLGGGSGVTTYCRRLEDATRLARYPITVESVAGRGHVRMLVTLSGAIATAAALEMDPASVDEVVVHELGHVLGLGHAPCRVHLMWSGELETTVPTPADRATVQVLYHTEPEITP